MSNDTRLPFEVEAEIPIHPVANIFPMMNDEEYNALLEDIEQNGQHEPIWVYEGKIIDGRNRYKACRELGITPEMREWDGHGSLVAFVVSLNLKRRHLSSGQKAVIAIEVEKQLAVEAKQRQGARNDIVQKFDQSSAGRAAVQAATITGTNRQYVSDAKKIAEQAPELLDDILDGSLSLPEAKTLAKLPEPQRASALQHMETKAARDVHHAAKLARAEARAAAPAPMIPPSITLEHADSTEHIKDNSINLILTDPPYGISAYKGVTKIGNQIVSADFDGDDDWDSVDPAQFLDQLYDWAEEWERVLKPGGAVVTFMDRMLVSYLWDALKRVGLQPKNTITWLKTNPSPASLARRNLISATELIVWAVKPGAPYTFNEVDGWDRRNAIVTSIIGGHERVDHPTQKPLAVLRPLMLLTSNPGDLVLDPFAGSGSTGAAALELGRNAHLIERDHAHFLTAQHRLGTQQEAA